MMELAQLRRKNASLRAEIERRTSARKIQTPTEETSCPEAPRYPLAITETPMFAPASPITAASWSQYAHADNPGDVAPINCDVPHKMSDNHQPPNYPSPGLTGKVPRKNAWKQEYH
eukprot:TRINITY_DN37263_c0_g1_i1.p2 TRINITY_DN37263_c0_g1~~TRINITY_DN37263_c0_g1_i1.p2  ORF type:complete len:116 (+),score=11.27 TRINITY_DN37263_c0_g1_i1:38-385(+)